MLGVGATTGSRAAASGGGPRARATGALGSLRLAVLTGIAAVLSAATIVALPIAEATAAPTNDLTVSVISARTEPRAAGGAGVNQGDSVDTFKFLINEDNTGSTAQKTPTGVCSPTDANYPLDCGWNSINAPDDASPIVAQGDQDALADGLTLDPGNYLISVLADGYKLGGQHFSMPLDPGPVVIELQPMPLPDSTVKGLVFRDMAPTNGAFDNGDQPLAGFQGHLNDLLGEVTTDVYGNPLCTTYVGEDPVTHEIPLAALDGDMLPIVETVGGECFSDADGILTFPHMGTNRYTQFVTPPDGSSWVQTTTLEGNHDWDSWVMEGSTGFDTEFAIAGEAVPIPLFGFAEPVQTLPNGNGSISGNVMRVLQYVPPKGGLFDLYNGFTGSKIQRPVTDAWLSLADLDNGDQAVWVGQANANGSFTIPNVPAGNYQLTWWDEAQNNLLSLQNVTVGAGESVALGTVPMHGWWTEYSGYVFNDKNRNGKQDAGENGIPNFLLTMRKRDNSLMDRGQTSATTDANGYYSFEGAYPLGEFGFTVMEAYSDSFYTTGVTYQADNAKTPTTIHGAGVDVSTLNIIGLGGTFDWGVHAYDPTGNNGVDPRNGGIVGSISYDTTRNELDPTFAASEDWQPGVPDVPVKLYSTVPCPDTGPTPDIPCDANENYQLDPQDGSALKGTLLNSYLSENWEKPRGCQALDIDGNPLVHGVDEDHLSTDPDGVCVPAFSESIQFGTYASDQGTTEANFGATVNGNYGFGDGCFNGILDASDPANPTCTDGNGNDVAFDALGSGDYLVSIEIPEDQFGTPLYKPTNEEDINVAYGNQIIPQVPPPACAGALHTVDVLDDGTDNYGPVDLGNGIVVPASTPVENPPFVDMGGSIYEGQQKPLCDKKLVTLNNGKSIVPMFNIFSDVPLPSRLRGLIIDDVNFSANPKNTAYGEKAPVPFVPIGIYDFTNRLVTTVESDYNGFYDVLLPSTNAISCPTPAGVCAGMYRFVGNDPGIPGALNPNYNPRFRVIGTEFEALPGVTIPTDLAPTQVGAQISRPGTGQISAITCPVNTPETAPAQLEPELYAVSQPYVNGAGNITIQGNAFGSAQGTGSVTLDGVAMDVTAWSDTQIAVTIPAGTPTGTHQLEITSDNGKTTANGLTFHVLGGSYNPALREVGPGRQYATVQAALDAALVNNGNDLVVVYPDTATNNNPRGAYYENLIMASPVKLQGVGPGGFQGADYVSGSIIDAVGFGGDTQLATDWYALLDTLTWDGNQTVNDGEGIYILASQNSTNSDTQAGQFTSAYPASIDGFDLRGGDQRGFPGNINEIGGQPTGLPPNITTQGGSIFANSYVRNLQITNNVVENNGGGYGTIRIGTPDLTGPDTDQQNENVRIAENRIINNAGTNLAGAIGLFAGSDNYEVAGNDICGNFSLEYGAGVSVYGRSPNGKIHHNRITFNQSNDEGAGIMIAGALPANPDALSPGSGPVDIYNNQIQANIANDDGGGIRFLQAGGNGGVDQMNVYNNMIVNNVSTHEGAGISLNDAPNVRIFNNTIMKNLTTATAVTSDGTAAPAGLSTGRNSDQLQPTLGNGAPVFSNPVLFNNVFWDNRAGTRAGGTVTGLGIGGDTIVNWDMGALDGSGLLSPTNSVLQTTQGTVVSGSNSDLDPGVVETYDVSVSFAPWRQNPAFVDATLSTVELPASQLGDYHLATDTSPAVDLGAAAKGAVNAPALDFDDQGRPAGAGFDSGADEFGATTPPPPADTGFYFSTAGNSNPPGVNGGADDADMYRYDGSAFSRVWDASGSGVGGGANVDAFSVIDPTHFYVSFTGNVTIARPGPDLSANDEDVLYYDNGTWTMWFDGGNNGLSGTDLGAMTLSGQTLYFSTNNTFVPPGAGGSGDNSDVYRWNGGTSYTRVVDADTLGLSVSGNNVDGLRYIDPTHFWMSFSDTNSTVPVLGAVQDEDIVEYNAGTWSVWFDGTAAGLTSGNLDIDAFSFGNDVTAPGPGPEPPPAPTPDPLFFSTVGDVNPPGVAGTADDSDIYGWDGTAAFSRNVDATGAPGIPAGSDVDGYHRVDDTHFYVSFANANTTLPVLGNVKDEDVVYYNGGTWSLYFDGSTQGLTASGEDLDAIDIVGSTLYFSTRAGVNPGVGGAADDADIYSWNGATMARAFDASANGIPDYANVDGAVRGASDSDWYLSFANASTALPGVGTVQDEDVVHLGGGSWSVYFDGTLHGLGTAAGLDVDAFDLP